MVPAQVFRNQSTWASMDFVWEDRSPAQVFLVDVDTTPTSARIQRLYVSFLTAPKSASSAVARPTSNTRKTAGRADQSR